MAQFLNTDLLNEWIPRLINEAERELVIIVPYIKTPDRIYRNLVAANNRGVETVLVYRENKLSAAEKAKLEAIDNLNLMHHPNVHAKCYYNGKHLIICSMNMYEFSARNNREMGVLLHTELLGETYNKSRDSDSIFNEAVHEIRAIIRGAHNERPSRETKEIGFEVEIIKSQKEKEEDYCREINQYFGHKKFEVVGTGNEWISVCENYFDKISVAISYRVILRLNFDEKKLQDIFKRFVPHYHEFRFDGFKFYWNQYKDDVFLYIDNKHSQWQNVSDEEHWQMVKRGIDDLISFLRQFM